MNLNELYNENKNPFQDVVDKVAAKEKQADAEHTKGLKDIADKFQSAEKKSSEEFSKKLRADEAKDTHCSDKCCGSDVKAEDCNCPPTCKHCDCNAIVSESQLPQQGVAEGSLDDIEDTRQFRNAIALAKSQKAIRHAKYGKDTKFYADGTPVTPEETARRAAERKARKQGVAEATEYGIPDSTPGQLPGGAKMTFGEFKKMWPGVILKRPSGGSLAGSVVADVEGWMNNPKSVWEPLEGVAEGWKDVVAGGAMALGALGAVAQTMPDVNVQQVELANKYYNVLVQRAKEDGIKLDTRTLNIIKAKAQDAAAKKTQQSTPQQSFPTQGSERRVAKDAGQFESQGVAEGSVTKKPQPYNDPNWVKNLPKEKLDPIAGPKYKKDKKEQGVAESQFDPINDDDFYEYNVNTNEIVKRISGKHPIARQFSPMQKEWAGRDADHKIVKGIYAKQLKPTVDEKVSDYLPTPLVNKHSIVKGWRKTRGLDEKAPEILSKAVGAVSGAVSGIGGALIGNMFAPLIGSIAGGAAGAIGGYKVGSAITDAIWDDIAKLFGGEKKAIAAGVAHAKAAAAGEKSFEFNGKKYPVTLKPQEVGKAVAELKAVKEAYTMEKAPPGAKAERMVKHVKKNYSKDGKLTPTEKSIAYATAWKAHNAGKV
jgi:hypothetical protein